MTDSAPPLVSIVIPTYNHGRFVTDAIDSCLAQTYPHYEIVVVDDGSTDGTPDRLRREYGAQVRVIVQANQGASASRNQGIAAARGTLIQFCDADDKLLPEKVAHSVVALLAQPDAALVHTRWHYVARDGSTVLDQQPPALPAPDDDPFCALLREDFIATCTVLARRDAILAVGGFDPALSRAEDWDLWLRLFAHYPVVALNEPLALVREIAGGLHTNARHMAESRLAVIRKARHYPGRARCLDDTAYDRVEAGRYHRLALLHWHEHRPVAARAALRAAIALDPAHSAVRRLYLALSYAMPAGPATALVNNAARLKSRLRG